MRDDDGVVVRELDGVFVRELDGVSVLDGDGVIVRDGEGVPVRDDDGVVVREGDGVDVCVVDGETSTTGGSATPRKTWHGPAVATTVRTAIALSHLYTVVRVAAYTTQSRAMPTISVRPTMEYTGSVVDRFTEFAALHEPATVVHF